MPKYVDSAQEKLYEALERSDEAATALLVKADKNENDGRAIVEALRGHKSAFIFIESRLREIEDAVKELPSAYARETSKVVLTVTLVGIGICVAILIR